MALFYLLIIILWKHYPGSPYLDIYKENGKFLILKISGEFLDDDEFEKFTLYLKYLQSLGVAIILVYGGGNQIREEYKKNTGRTREEGKDGLNTSNPELIEKGVIPAYQRNQQKLEAFFGTESVLFFEKEDIICKQNFELGEVGRVEKFTKDFSKTKINIVPFVGISNQNNNSLNVNADDIVEKIVKNIRDEISNIIFFTGTGGVLDNTGEVVSFLTKEKLDAILTGDKAFISLDGGMLKKMQSIKKLFESKVTKVTIAHLSACKEELEGFGLGTMIVDFGKAQFSKIGSREMFNLIFDYNLNNGDWRDRTESEKEVLFGNYITLEIDGTILGGYALSDCEVDGEKGKLLECLFSTKIGGGLGYTLGSEIKKQGCVFAYSKKGDFFESIGFKKVIGKTSQSGAPLYAYRKPE